MKLAIVGSREFNDYEYLKKMLQFHKCTKIISGGAKGADTLAEKYAVENNITFQNFPANWDAHGKSAGYIRNKQIVDACDELIAFWNKKSKGTKHSIDLANNAGKSVYIYWPDLLEGIGI